VFEVFHSITADPVRKCPQCTKSKVKRLLGTGAGIIFKGSGFYQTDYRSESYKTAAKADSGGAASADSKKSGDTTTTSSAKSAQTQSNAAESGKSSSSDKK
jgi:putative FmdB family regulatory protein